MLLRIYSALNMFLPICMSLQPTHIIAHIFSINYVTSHIFSLYYVSPHFFSFKNVTVHTFCLLRYCAYILPFVCYCAYIQPKLRHGAYNHPAHISIWRIYLLNCQLSVGFCQLALNILSFSGISSSWFVS